MNFWSRQVSYDCMELMQSFKVDFYLLFHLFGSLFNLVVPERNKSVKVSLYMVAIQIYSLLKVVRKS